MAIQTPDVDLATFLAGLGTFGVLGTDIKYGPRRSVLELGNDTATIWLESQPGQAPFDMMNQAISGSIYYPKVMLIVLSAADAREAGLTKARQVRQALHLKTVPSSSPAAYLICRSTQSDVNYDGPIPEMNGQHEFSDNFELTWVG
jgi:hypothetical protein